MKDDLYKILGIDKNASKEEITKAFKDQAKHDHPDKKGGDKEKFQKLNEAYNILKDEVKRNHYDKTGDTDLPLSKDQIAKNTLVTIFYNIINNADESLLQNDIFDIMRNQLTTLKREINNAIRDSIAKIKVIKKIESRIKGKQKEFFQNICEKKIEEETNLQEKLKIDTEMADLMLSILKNCDFDVVMSESEENGPQHIFLPGFGKLEINLGEEDIDEE
jgi:DnaJ-class molecular chaperone